MLNCQASADQILQRLRQNTVVFLHAGHVFGVGSLLQDVARAFEASGRTVVPIDVAIDKVGNFSIPDTSGDLIVVNGIGGLAHGVSRCEILANLRACLMPSIEAGVRVLLASSTPKRQLQGCPGSSLILDAATAFLSRLSQSAVSKFGAELSVDGQRDLWAYSQGFPRLIHTVLSVSEEMPDGTRADCLSAIKDAVCKDLCAAIGEAGPEFASTLDYYVNELSLFTVECAEVDAAVIEGWRGSGFASSPDGWVTAELFGGSLRPLWTAALRTYADSTLDVPRDWTAVSEELWEIERRVREAVRARAEERSGKGWRTNSLSPALAARAVERAQADALPSSRTAADLPNPFEWLTLAEITQLIEEQEWARPAAIPLVFWRRLQAELFPVRNRVAHMRLLRPSDGDTVRRWLNQVRRLLS